MSVSRVYLIISSLLFFFCYTVFLGESGCIKQREYRYEITNLKAHISDLRQENRALYEKYHGLRRAGVKNNPDGAGTFDERGIIIRFQGVDSVPKNENSKIDFSGGLRLQEMRILYGIAALLLISLGNVLLTKVFSGLPSPEWKKSSNVGASDLDAAE